MRKTRFLLTTGGLTATLMLGLTACQSATTTSNIDKRTAEPTVEYPTKTATAEASPANPIEQYKQKIVREAMEGLRYDSGRVEIDLQHPRNLENIGNLHAARAAYDQGQFDLDNHNNILGAIRNFTDAVIIAPNEPTLYIALGEALSYKGRNKPAEAAFRTALDLNPNMIDAMQDLANLLNSVGRENEAIAEWNAVLKLDPNNAEAHGRLALAYYYQNDYAQSQNHLRRADQLGYDGIPPQFRPLLASHSGK